MTKQTCRNCHFLAEYNDSDHGAKPRGSWPVDSRSHIPNPVSNFVVPGCYMRVWRLRGHTLGDLLSSDIDREDLPDCLDQDRKGDCFFFEAKDGGMSLKAAEILERRQSDQRAFQTTIRIAMASACAALGAAAAAWASMVRGCV